MDHAEVSASLEVGVPRLLQIVSSYGGPMLMCCQTLYLPKHLSELHKILSSRTLKNTLTLQFASYPDNPLPCELGVEMGMGLGFGSGLVTITVGLIEEIAYTCIHTDLVLLGDGLGLVRKGGNCGVYALTTVLCTPVHELMS